MDFIKPLRLPETKSSSRPASAGSVAAENSCPNAAVSQQDTSSSERGYPQKRNLIVRLKPGCVEQCLRKRLDKMFADRGPVVRQPKPLKREKERKLGDILYLVHQWLQTIDNIREMPDADDRDVLEEAAVFIGMPRKTMVEYVLKVRNGHHFGFNYEAHLDEGIGRLR